MFCHYQDPRVETNSLICCPDILTIAILSVMAGGEGWEDMELYGVKPYAWLSTFLLANGIPSEDTFRRVFERIDPKQFEDCFEGWVKQLVNELGIQVIAVDSKRKCNGSMTANQAQSPTWSVRGQAEHRLVLAKRKLE